MSELKITLATPNDEEQILSLAMNAWAENGLTDIEIEKVRAMIRPALYLWQGLCGVFKQPNGRIEGGVLLRMTQMWYSDSWLLEEKIIFVDPEFRNVKGGRAGMLCDFSKKVADDLGIPLLIGVLSNTRTKSKTKLYERKFGEPAGAFFLYGAKTGHSVMMEN
jgi:hypothetical protein